MKKFDHAFLIDDDEIINRMNTKLIESSKIASKVSSVTNPKEALDRLQEMAISQPDQFPEIIFLDIDMPRMNGWQFLQEVAKFPKSILEKCRVIMLSSSIDLFHIKKAKAYGMVNDYIAKPLEVSHLHVLRSPKHQPFSVCEMAVRKI